MLAQTVLLNNIELVNQDALEDFPQVSFSDKSRNIVQFGVIVQCKLIYLPLCSTLTIMQHSLLKSMQSDNSP